MPKNLHYPPYLESVSPDSGNTNGKFAGKTIYEWANLAMALQEQVATLRATIASGKPPHSSASVRAGVLPRGEDPWNGDGP